MYISTVVAIDASTVDIYIYIYIYIYTCTDHDSSSNNPAAKSLVVVVVVVVVSIAYIYIVVTIIIGVLDKCLRTPTPEFLPPSYLLFSCVFLCFLPPAEILKSGIEISACMSLVCLIWQATHIHKAK